MVQVSLSEHVIGSIEEILWVDCEGQHGWDTIEAHLEKVGGTLSVVSVGYVLCEDKLSVTLIQSHDVKNGTVDAYVTIPKCSISKRVKHATKLKLP